MVPRSPGCRVQAQSSGLQESRVVQSRCPGFNWGFGVLGFRVLG